MADATYQPSVYRKQGSTEWVVASGGKITIESGGQFEAVGVDVVDELNALGDVGLTTGELVYLDAVTAGTAAVGKALVLASTKKHVDTLAVTELLVGAGTSDGVAITSGELSAIDGVTAGTATVGKAVVLASTKKHVDLIALTELYVGSGTSDGVALTSGDANLIDGLTPGTVTASKAVTAGTAKNVDTLAIATLHLGSDTSSGSQVTATAPEINLTDNQVASVAYTIAAFSTSYVQEVTLQLKDAAGVAINGARFVPLVFLADSSGTDFSVGTTVGVLSTGTNAATCKVHIPSTSGKLAYGITSTSGLLNLKWSDTGKTVTWLGAILPNGSYAITSVAITTTSS